MIFLYIVVSIVALTAFAITYLTYFCYILSKDYKILEMYKFPVSETQIPIQKLLLYPVRGVRGIEVNEIKMTANGPKFDREWIVVRSSDKKYRSLTFTPELTRLR